jgi:hypothetical protein
MLRFTLSIVAMFLIAGCVTMSSQAELVQVVYNPLELNPACTSLGVVEGWDQLWRDGQGHENAEREMRELVATLGGNVLLSLYSRGGAFGVRSRGQAYRCP